MSTYILDRTDTVEDVGTIKITNDKNIANVL